MLNNKYTHILSVTFLLSIFSTYLGAQEAVLENCQVYYEKTGVCPKEVCNIGCLGGIIYEDCDIGCVPKPCVELSAENCPLNVCQVIPGCSGADICFPLNEYAPPSCGGLAYNGSDVQCCRGLVKRCGVEFFDGTCDMVGRNSIYIAPICIPCGNGYCNQFENACNCPEDCKKDYTNLDQYTGERFGKEKEEEEGEEENLEEKKEEKKENKKKN